MCISLYDVNSSDGSDEQTQMPALADMIRCRAGAGFGGAYRDRTDDPLLAKQVLSQLS